MIIIKWHSEEEEVLNFVIKGRWTGRAGRDESMIERVYFPQTQVSMWRCAYFLSCRHSVAWVFLLGCLPSWVFEENSENWRFHSVYGLKPHAVLLSSSLAISALSMKTLSWLWASLFKSESLCRAGSGYGGRAVEFLGRVELWKPAEEYSRRRGHWGNEQGVAAAFQYV